MCALKFGAYPVNFLPLLLYFSSIQTASHRQALGVVGNRDILKSHQNGCLRHFKNRVSSICPVALHLQVAPKRPIMNTIRQSVRFAGHLPERRLNFSGIFSKLRRHISKSQLIINLLFGSAGEYFSLAAAASVGIPRQRRRSAPGGKKSVFTKLPAFFYRKLAQSDVVAFGAGERQKSRPVRPLINYP